MIVRRLGWAALVGASLLSSATGLRAGEPARLPLTSVAEANQQLADAVAAQVRLSALLKGYRVDIAVSDGGSVELTGKVADQAQREEVLRMVQGVPGVVKVTDRLTGASAAGSGIRPVQASDGPPAGPATLPPPDNNGAGGGAIPPGNTGPIVGDLTPPPGAGAVAPKANGGGAPIPEPGAIFRAPVPAHYGLNPPFMPPHAWPTYAPYNNFSRVAVPTAYPHNAFPFIGPMYPFPKVPLGWRAVKLEWDDGYWWYGRVGVKHDWWKLRFF